MISVLNCLRRCQRTLFSHNVKRIFACNMSIHDEIKEDENLEPKANLKVEERNTKAEFYRSHFATPDVFNIDVHGMKFSEVPVVTITSARSNTFLSLATIGSGTSSRNTIAQVSCGGLGFNNAKKKTQYAAQACSLRISELAKDNNINTVRVVLRGFGVGRQPALEGLKIGGLRIISITDDSKLRQGRPPCRRRV